jgi:cytochrome oxidase Cu insertion factor (SCO1/SenC/PrrC family)
MRAVLLACVLALGCGGRDDVYEGHGHVVEVDRAQSQVVIEHEQIAGLMPPMTMSFDVADPGLLEHLSPGQAIDFDLEVEGDKFRIVGARDAGGAPGARRSPILASVASEAQPAPGFTLTDQDGRQVSLSDLRGQAVLVDFVYTTCNGPCPILTARQVELQRALEPALRERVHFVSISLDPVRDTPQVLGEYARARGADLSGWSFLTGPEPEVADVVRRFGVGSLRAPDGSIEHTVATFLVDGGGTIAKRWLGLQDRPADMRSEIARVASAARP